MSNEDSLAQYLRDISAYEGISPERELALAPRIRLGDADALDELVRSNLPYVVRVAERYQNRGRSLSDLINEGNLGLIRAAHKFDESTGTDFISFAKWWIHQAIAAAFDDPASGSPPWKPRNEPEPESPA